MIIVFRNEKIPFAGKKHDVRIADDIMRQSKLDFPCLSSTYAAKSYSSIRKDLTGCSRSTQIMNKIINNIYHFLRGGTRPASVKGAEILDRLKQYKVGNCYEKTIAAIAEFSAKGYVTLPVYLGLRTFLFDKQLDKIVNCRNWDLDHVLAVTYMNNNDRKQNDKLIIIDPWMGFCAEENDAKGKYTKFFYDKICSFLRNYKLSIKPLCNKNTEIRHKIGFFDTKTKDKELNEIYSYLKKDFFS